MFLEMNPTEHSRPALWKMVSPAHLKPCPPSLLEIALDWMDHECESKKYMGIHPQRILKGTGLVSEGKQQ